MGELSSIFHSQDSSWQLHLMRLAHMGSIGLWLNKHIRNSVSGLWKPTEASLTVFSNSLIDSRQQCVKRAVLLGLDMLRSESVLLSSSWKWKEKKNAGQWHLIYNSLYTVYIYRIYLQNETSQCLPLHELSCVVWSMLWMPWCDHSLILICLCSNWK